MCYHLKRILVRNFRISTNNYSPLRTLQALLTCWHRLNQLSLLRWTCSWQRIIPKRKWKRQSLKWTLLVHLVPMAFSLILPRSFVYSGVVTTVLEMLNSRPSFHTINQTFITLIPKKSIPRLVSNYRSISLCNVLYKIIAKVIANRLKSILPHLIVPAQSAFVSGRLISDNTIVANEVLHSM